MTDPAILARHAVYALARTQLDWIPVGRQRETPAPGFSHGPLRHAEVCPDCLADDFQHVIGCETCGGTGELPGPDRDPYETREATRVGGLHGEREHERARWIDGQLLELSRLARIRANAEQPEDWLDRALRLKDQQWARGDYPLLEQAQQLLGIRLPYRHLAWTTFVVDAQPLSVESAALVRLDETADWLAARILAAIAGQVALMRELGQKRTRCEEIRVPPEHWDAELRAHQAAAGKGRWANGHTQGERNALIVAMDAEGRTAGEIGRRVGLTRRRVQQLLAELHATHGATGPAA